MTAAGSIKVGGPAYQATGSGSLASGASTGNMSIQFPTQSSAASQTYLFTVHEYGAQTTFLQTYLVDVPEATVNVGWNVLIANTYSQGSVSVSTQNGGGQYAFNASSNETMLVNISAGSSGGTYTWDWSYMPINNTP